MNAPLVSVNMPVFNGERFIGEAIESILTQSFEDFELIIIDDGSTDNTNSILEHFTDSRIKVIHVKKRGLANARNLAIINSQGKYIAILDSDDVAYADRLKKQVGFMERHPLYCLVAGQTNYINSASEIIGSQYLYYNDDKEIPVRLFFHNPITQSTVMLRKNMLPSKLPYDPAFPPAEDYHLWVRMAKKNPMHILKEPLVKYRIHTSNISSKQQHLMDECVRNIMKYQLEQAGIINPTSAEINMHLSIAYDCWSSDEEFIENACKFFIRLEKANKESNYVSSKILHQVISKYMEAPLNSFFVRKKYDHRIFKDLFSKNFHASKYLDIETKLRLIFKSILRYEP